MLTNPRVIGTTVIPSVSTNISAEAEVVKSITSVKPLVVEATAKISQNSSAECSVSDNPKIVSIESGVAVSSSSLYKGDYESTPTPFEQTYETKGLNMKEDFVVHRIPVHEMPNEYGTTLTIGE